jgi:parallel beta-helix repeat protein
MTGARNSKVLWIIPLLLMVMLFCPFAYSKVINIDDDGQADFDNIQAGIDAAEYGDTVCVAAGTYYENVALKDGINLLGAGADVTIIDANGYGDVVDARANNVTICGFTLRNSGEFDLSHTNCGVHLNGTYAPIVRNNVIINNRIGIGIWYGANPDIRNNIIQNNSNGLYIYGSNESPSNPAIINNTIVNNEGNGITLRVMVSPIIANNIITGHITGINHNYVTGTPSISYNNLWDNDVNYMRDSSIDDTLAGVGSISADPCFAEPGYWADVNKPNIIIEPNDPNAVWIDGDYHLKSQAGRYNPNTQTWVVDDITSSCVDAGDPNSPVAFEPFPNGGLVNMGAYGGAAEASKSPSGLHASYGGGTGEPNDPYLIYTAEHLNAIGAEPNDWDKHFKIMADIDLAGFVYDGAPIASDLDPCDLDFQGASFTGVFDGNGRKVSHLTIRGSNYLGLFGRTEFEAELINLGVVDVNITGSGDYISALVGFSRGNISTSYSTGFVSGDKRVGGLAGRNWGIITISYSTVTVAGNSYIGGLAANNYGSITMSYSTGAVHGNQNIGGLVGDNYGSIAESYSTGTVTGETRFGGLLGYNWADASITSSFWDVETSGQTMSAGGTGLTTAEMQTARTFLDAGWDFVDETGNGTEDIWWIDEGKDYPRLSWELLTNDPSQEQGQ